MSDWINVKQQMPSPGDYSVLVYFSETQSVEMVHVSDYFMPITNGVLNGEQQYTYWYSTRGVTHWMYLPNLPSFF